MDISRKKTEPETQSPRLTPWQLALLATVLSVVILTIDLLLPLGVAAGVPYVAVVLLGWWFPKRNHIIILAALSTTLTLIGYFYSSEGNILWMIHVNRFLALFAIWVSAVLLIAAKTATGELAKSEQRYMRLADNTPAGIWQITPEGKTVYINNALARMFELDDPEEAVGRFCADFVTPDSAEQISNQLPAREKGYASQYEIEIVGKKGGKRSALLAGSPLFNEKEEFVGRIATLIDVTDRNRAEKKLKQAEEQLRRTQKMDAVGQMVGGIAHDFNNILGIVMGNLEILRDEVGEESGKRVGSAMKGAQRGAELTRKLLAFSSHDIVDTKVISIADVIEGMSDLLQKSLTPSIEIKSSLADDLWPVKVDPNDFEDVIVNLALNARDAMPEGGKLVVEAENKKLDEDFVALGRDFVPGDYVLFSMGDTGAGMTPEVMEKALEPFFTSKEEGKGTGLGLSMVYGFVKRSGGYIKIYSEPGEGTTVRIYLPRSVDGVEALTEPAEEVELLRGTETVLVVDDEAQLVDVSVHHLESLGYQTLSANSGEEALEVLASGKNVDVLFSDIVMHGGMDGYELTKKALKQHPTLKVLLTTGFTTKHEDVLVRRLSPSSQLMKKPYTKSELARNIRQVLDS